MSGGGCGPWDVGGYDGGFDDYDYAYDAGPVCEGAARPRPDPDLSVIVGEPMLWSEPPAVGVRFATYEGPVTVTRVGADALELTGEDGTKATWSGAHPVLAEGTTLWASFDQRQPNAFGSFDTRSSRVSVGRDGPVLAEDLVGELSGSRRLRFLGVETSLAWLCEVRTLCTATDYFVATIHGDDDVRLLPGQRGQVWIAGAPYALTLVEAKRVRDLGCTPSPHTDRPLLHLVGRRLGSADALDAGMDASPELDAGDDADGGDLDGGG